MKRDGRTQQEAERICGALQRDTKDKCAQQIALATDQTPVDNFWVLARQDGRLVAHDLGRDEPQETKRDREADGFALIRQFKDDTNRAETSRRPLQKIIERARRIVEDDAGRELRRVVVARGQERRLKSGRFKNRVLYRAMTAISFREGQQSMPEETTDAEQAHDMPETDSQPEEVEQNIDTESGDPEQPTADQAEGEPVADHTAQQASHDLNLNITVRSEPIRVKPAEQDEGDAPVDEGASTEGSAETVDQNIELDVEYDGEPLDDPEAIMQAVRDNQYPLAGENGYPVYNDSGAIVQRVDASRMSADFVILTRSKRTNRHGAKVRITPGGGGQGMLTENFERNPIVLFGHGLAGLPFGGVIGTARDPQSGQVVLSKNRQRMTGRAFFSQRLPEAEIVFGLIEEGILNAASVQFMPLKARRLKMNSDEVAMDDDDDIITFGAGLPFDFVESDLWEFSVVPVPADPGALRRSVEQGHIHGAKFTAQLSALFNQVAEQPKVWASGFGVSVRQNPDQQPTPVDSVSGPADTEADKRKRLAAEIRAQRSKQSLPRLSRDQLRSVFRESVVPIEQKVDGLASRQDRVDQALTQLTGRVD